MKSQVNKTLALILGFVLVACQKAPSVQIETKNIVVPELKTFGRDSVQLINNRFFLWKEDMTDKDVTAALHISDELDIAEDYLKIQLRLDYPDSYKLFDDNRTKLGTFPLKIKMAQQKIAKNNAEIQRLNTEIAGYQDEMSKINPPDETKTKELQGKIQADQAAVNTQNQQLTKNNTDLASLQDTYTKLVDFKKIYDPWDKKANEKANELQSVTQMGKSFPSSINFGFDDNGKPQVRIEAWDVPDDTGEHADQDRNFSSQSNPDTGAGPNIRNVTYTEKGGIWEFDIVTDPEVLVDVDGKPVPVRTMYTFKVARTKYDDKYGRVIFAGDFNRTKNGVLTRGSAKLVDRNN